ncbi:MAG: dTDP-4-dehydrorhamnose 3,5-epimerase [Bacteroidales bacterium]|nr:dTDP-4-dehydrorhamnose 3,5-epimerase [Bacteroidales bacterium]HOY40023.1 dTDP-4-dehydrorhamnose 3,5-epimerase [Bacteroidales bacterium]HQP03784.1 dTDP-4-dehydrorhamnose 3,5-epimerase [Bacteroidales bacterium]
MEIIPTPIPGLLIIEPKVFGDPRGYFMETWSKAVFDKYNIPCSFVQDNESMSNYGVVRGLHYQLEPYAQAKLVRVVSGSVYDVALDIRKGSPTFGKWFGLLLSGENKKQFFVPRGFAHGFAVLEDKTIFSYKCDNLYNKEHERGISFADPALGISWPIDFAKAIISEKDKHNPSFDQAEYNFTFRN